MGDKIFFGVEIDIERFGIKNDGTSPLETSAGLNQALQFAKEGGFSKIILPTGTYLIHETAPILIDIKNAVIDLNGSTLQINTNGLEKYSIVEFRDGAENVRLTNGTIRGDKDTHDYLTIKGGHEWGCGLLFKTGTNLQMDNITVTNMTGYGISIESGLVVTADRYYTLWTKDVTQGAISDSGDMVASTTTTRTVNAYDISVCGGQFELGYTLGYLGYPYLKNREYTAYFYDNNMAFIQKKDCLQFRKVDIPSGAKYVHFVYPQASVVSDLGYYAWITNLKPPTNCKLTDCLIEGNRCLGLAVCGGQQWTVENNIFKSNGGAAANHAVDFEDSFELIQDYMFKNNKFINNKYDLTVAAGDNLMFEDNEFQNGAFVWERTTNYKFIGNKFNGGVVKYKIKRTGCEIRDNRYVNSNLSTASLSALTITLNHETLINTHIGNDAPGTKFVDSNITSTIKPYMSDAVLENCTIEVAGAEASSLVFKYCKIKNSEMNLHADHNFENCEIVNSKFVTYSNTTQLQFKSSQLMNSQMMVTTSGAASVIIFDGCYATMTTDLPLVLLSAGKTRNLIFSNNTVVNEIAKPVIELYDTWYTLPNGNATIQGNNFTQSNYGYVFDGVNITSGIFTFTDKNNTITGAVMLSPKYIGNPHFVINT